MSMPGFWELTLILAVVTLLFGGKKLPQLGGAVGEAIRNFKRGIKDDGSRQIEASSVQANAQANVEASLENNKQA